MASESKDPLLRSGALCGACGACCQPSPDSPSAKRGVYAYVFKEELQSPIKKKIFSPHLLRQHIKTKVVDGQQRCIFLKGTVGECVSCLVYEHRPAVCREFDPGGEECLEARLEAFGPKE